MKVDDFFSIRNIDGPNGDFQLPHRFQQSIKCIATLLGHPMQRLNGQTTVVYLLWGTVHDLRLE